MLKHVWQSSVVDLASWNSDVVEEVWLEEFQELYRNNQEEAEWDVHKDEIVDT
jgi:hypothetical protein